MKKLTLTIEGMNCNSCIKKVETALNELDNINSINVKKGEAEIEITDEIYNEKMIRRIIDKAGYRLTEIKGDEYV